MSDSDKKSGVSWWNFITNAVAPAFDFIRDKNQPLLLKLLLVGAIVNCALAIYSLNQSTPVSHQEFAIVSFMAALCMFSSFLWGLSHKQMNVKIIEGKDQWYRELKSRILNASGTVWDTTWGPEISVGPEFNEDREEYLAIIEQLIRSDSGRIHSFKSLMSHAGDSHNSPQREHRIERSKQLSRSDFRKRHKTCVLPAFDGIMHIPDVAVIDEEVVVISGYDSDGGGCAVIESPALALLFIRWLSQAWSKGVRTPST
jgi:hypothetical protein